MIQQGLPSDKIVIYCDTRECSNHVVKILKKKFMDKCETREKQLNVADYILGKVAVERKTTNDFINSIIDKRLFSQIEKIKENYPKYLLIIEGESIIHHERKIHPNAVFGALASVALDSNFPVVSTKNENETARLLFAIAKREQMGSTTSITIRDAIKPKSENHKQEFLVAGLPSINSKTAKKFLKHFGSPIKFFNASLEELKKVEGIGEKKALSIYKLLRRKYEKSILE